eukprot:sb/3476379/
MRRVQLSQDYPTTHNYTRPDADGVIVVPSTTAQLLHDSIAPGRLSDPNQTKPNLKSKAHFRAVGCLPESHFQFSLENPELPKSPSIPLDKLLHLGNHRVRKYAVLNKVTLVNIMGGL